MVWLGLLISASVGFAAPIETSAQTAWNAYGAHVGAHSDAGFCGTTVVAGLKAHWDELSVEQQVEAQQRLGPLWLKGSERPPVWNLPGGATETCWDQTGTHRLVTDHFAVEWDDGVSEEAAIEFGEYLEAALAVEVDELGWRAPDGMENYLLLAYITDEDYSGAYTTVGECGDGYMPYIVTGRSALEGSGRRWPRNMAAHEFNHASQFGYGYAHEFWFWEATATYIEEYVYPQDNMWSSYIEGYSANPWLAMNVEQRSDPDKFLHMYGMAVWNFHLDEHVGGHDLVRGLWEHSEGRPYMLLPMTMEDGLTELGYDFTAIYEDFMAVNTVMDYREHYSFPSVTVRQMVYTLPAEGSVEDSRRPQTLGQDYIRIALSQTDAAKPDLFLSFDGNALGEWRVLLVGTVGQEAREVVSLEVVDGVGEGVLLNVDDFDDAWLVASPLRQASQGFTYQWSLWRDLSPDRPAPGSATGGVDLSSGGFGCACSSSSRWLTWGWALVPLLALLRRRKRLGVAGC